MSGSRAAWALAAGLVYLIGTPGLVLGVALLAVAGAATAGCGTGGDPAGGGQVGDRQWTGEQLTHAQTITGIVEQRRLPQRAAVLALSTAIVESNLINVPYGDRDSLGLFQQRPSQGWGSAEQVSDPAYATNAFLDHLIALEGWWRLPPGVAQQTVQASAYPERYAPQEASAGELMNRFWRGPDNPPPANGAAPAAQAAVCGDPGGASTPLDPQQLPPGYRLPAEPNQRAAVQYALAQLGKPYVFGAKGPDAFDCSGLMQAAWAHAGVPISAGTTSQIHDGRAVAALGQLAPGDLVFIPGSLGSPSNPRHVGMYAGYGLIVNAYDEGTGVVLEQLDAWEPQVVAIRRVSEPRGANA
ncbi:C40 family peptidase [Saccharopolyspora gloriosae]|uniref:C40 family peptidase n=1 Tax=Saccharopolyspora gloriosae TaxID=455344 RepID=UPI001FB6A046|nr:NlpC/P60 family protein [Saccharopolyspora gloriosae]